MSASLHRHLDSPRVAHSLEYVISVISLPSCEYDKTNVRTGNVQGHRLPPSTLLCIVTIGLHATVGISDRRASCSTLSTPGGLTMHLMAEEKT